MHQPRWLLISCLLASVVISACSDQVIIRDREASCGNGTVEQGEACDDGNRVDGDGCQADCTAVGLPPGGAQLKGRTGMSQSGSSGSTLRGRAGESALPKMQSERFKLKGGLRRAAP